MPVLQTVGPVPGRPAAAAPERSSAALRKYGALPMPKLEWNAEVERETAPLYARIQNVVPPNEWPFFAPYVLSLIHI